LRNCRMLVSFGRNCKVFCISKAKRFEVLSKYHRCAVFWWKKMNECTLHWKFFTLHWKTNWSFSYKVLKTLFSNNNWYHRCAIVYMNKCRKLVILFHRWATLYTTINGTNWLPWTWWTWAQLAPTPWAVTWR